MLGVLPLNYERTFWKILCSGLFSGEYGVCCQNRYMVFFLLSPKEILNEIPMARKVSVFSLLVYCGKRPYVSLSGTVLFDFSFI